MIAAYLQRLQASSIVACLLVDSVGIIHAKQLSMESIVDRTLIESQQHNPMIAGPFGFTHRRSAADRCACILLC